MGTRSIRTITWLLAVGAALAGAGVAAPSIALASPDTTATQVQIAPVSPIWGQPTTFTAHVTDSTTPATTPTGSVQFDVDGVPLGAPVALSGGDAQATTSTLSTFTHFIGASYTPDNTTTFAASSGSSMVTVNLAPTSVQLTFAPQLPVAGQWVTATALVVPDPLSTATPTGTVKFQLQDGTPIGSPMPVGADGRAHIDVIAGAGAWPFKALYSGDSNFLASVGVGTHNVIKADTFVTMSASPNPAAIGQDIHFTTRVDSRPPSEFAPAGMVSFTLNGGPILAPAYVEDGDELFIDVSFPFAGAFEIGSHYAGTSSFNPSEATLPLTIVAPPAPAPAAPAPAPATPTPPPSSAASTSPRDARGLSVKVTPSRDRRAPYRFTVSGRLLLPPTITAAKGCTGNVRLDARMGKKRVARKSARVARTCTWSARLGVPRRGKVSVTVAFAGNSVVKAVTARTLQVRAG